MVINESQVTSGNSFMTSGTPSYYILWKWWTFPLSFRCWQKIFRTLKNYVCVLSCVCILTCLDVHGGQNGHRIPWSTELSCRTWALGSFLMPSRRILNCWAVCPAPALTDFKSAEVSLLKLPQKFVSLDKYDG